MKNPCRCGWAYDGKKCRELQKLHPELNKANGWHHAVAPFESVKIRVTDTVNKKLLRAAVSKWLLPNKRGRVEGYGGDYPKGDPWKHETWSDGYDFQHAAIDIWEAVTKP